MAMVIPAPVPFICIKPFTRHSINIFSPANYRVYISIMLSGYNGCSPSRSRTCAMRAKISRTTSYAMELYVSRRTESNCIILLTRQDLIPKGFTGIMKAGRELNPYFTFCRRTPMANISYLLMFVSREGVEPS